jgi:hypothetical protein
MPEARKAWILDLTFEMRDRIEQGLHAVAGKAGCVGPTRAVKRPSEGLRLISPETDLDDLDPSIS